MRSIKEEVEHQRKQKILTALLIGLDAAKEVAENYHQAMAGHCKNTHKQLDDDVLTIELAISLLSETYSTPLSPHPECKCSMRTKLVGDGCAVCNPQYAADMKE